jgi:hypothetical protein
MRSKEIISTSYLKAKVKDQHGLLAVDYLFAFVIGMGLFLLLFAFTLTLSMTSIAQYIAFSSSRSFASAHKSLENQEALARNKFNELKNSNTFGPLFQNGWFDLQIESVRGGGARGQDFSQDYIDFRDPQEIRQPSVGIRLNFTASILNFRNPLLGNAQSEEDDGFTTRVTGLMNREPSASECMNQMRREVRYSQILRLDPRFSILGTPAQQKYQALEDNGC